ncbi:MAG: right-handed parallel beta-helix repeat-containing protein [Bacteroidetes bacterium]|nr:right-handed parallel beta-helix repeat-containing protein [Bacteroidota bacterium]
MFYSKLLLQALLCLCLIKMPAFGANYYFSSTSGNDNATQLQAQNPGTPWRTLSKLNAMIPSLAAGDSILFKRGEVFSGNITVSRSGLIFSAYGSGSNPVISGFQSLSFTSIGNNLWESNSLSTKPNILLYNNVMQLPGRFPNTGYLTLESNTNSTQFTDNQLTGNWVGGEVAVRKNNWVFDKGWITAQSGGTITYQNQSGDDHTPNWGYFIQHHPSALDINGEWYYNRSTQKIILFSTTTPGTATVSTTAQLVTLNNQSATFTQLNFEGANGFSFYLNGATGTRLINCNISYSGSFGLYGSNSNNLQIDGCTFTLTNNVSLLLSSCKNSTLTNNTIQTTGVEGQGEGLNVTSLEYTALSVSYSDGTVIRGNKVFKSGYNGINFLFGNNYLIENNQVDDFCSIKDDGGGIYTWNGNGNTIYSGCKIIGNIVSNGKAATAARNNPWYTPAIGIYMDDNAGYIEMTGNTVSNCSGSGLYLHNAHDMLINNNIVYNCGGSATDPASVGQIQYHGDNGGYLIRNMRVFGNQFVSRFNYQLVLKWDTNFNDVLAFGTGDSNYYARPIDDNLMARIIASGTNPFYTLAGWQSYSKQDPNSKKSPRSINSVDSIRLVSNATFNSVTIPLGATYMDITGKIFAGSITLAPYQSAVLIYQSASLPNTEPIIKLNSYPVAAATLYLDFDGQTVVSPYYNGGNALYCMNPTLNSTQITRIFNQVAEDFRPFNLNITTDSAVYFAAPATQRMRIIITPTSNWYPQTPGVSITESFRWGMEVPAFVFSDVLSNNAKNIAETISHEAGHTLGLQHQALYNSSCALVNEFNAGIGTGDISWAPIMGNGFSKNLTLWHNGTIITGCNNLQNDLSVIAGTANGFGFRNDDISNTITNAQTVTFSNNSYSQTGYINSTNDPDFFKVDLPAQSRLQVSGKPYKVAAPNEAANIDLQLNLHNNSGTLLRSYNPADSITTSMDTLLPTGTYYLSVTNISNINTNNYGMLGSYELNANYAPNNTLPVYSITLSGSIVNRRHELSWTIVADEPISLITVEISRDGISFSKLQDLSGDARSFSYLPPDTKTRYYRIKAVVSSGTAYYSNVIVIKKTTNSTRLRVVQPKAGNSEIMVQSKIFVPYQLYDISGRLLQKGNINLGINYIRLEKIRPGIYVLQYTDEGKTETEKVWVE